MLSHYLQSFINSKKNYFLFGDYEKNYTQKQSIEIINKFITNLNKIKKSQNQLGIGIYLPRNSNYFLAIFAIWLSGNYFIPLNQLWPKQHLKKIIKHSNPSLIISNKKISGCKKSLKFLYLKNILNEKKNLKQLKKKKYFKKKNCLHNLYFWFYRISERRYYI